jgi:hypothetical protein
LTYPKEYPTARASKVHLEAFRERLKRKYGSGACGFWKLEPQKRGAPHYHALILLNPRALGWKMSSAMRAMIDEGFLPDADAVELDGLQNSFREWVCKSWVDVVGSDDDMHRRFHEEIQSEKVVQFVESSNLIRRYLCKYVGKPADGDAWREPGRFWGYVNRDKLLSLLRGEVYVVSREVYYFMRRCFRRAASHAVQKSGVARHGKRWQTFDRGGGTYLGSQFRAASMFDRLLWEFTVRRGGRDGPCSDVLKLGDYDGRFL